MKGRFRVFRLLFLPLMLAALAAQSSCSAYGIADRVLLRADDVPAEGTVVSVPTEVALAVPPTPRPLVVARRPTSIHIAHLSIAPGSDQSIIVNATPGIFLNIIVTYSNGIINDDGTRLGAQVDDRGQFSRSWQVDRLAPGGRTSVAVQETGTNVSELAFFVIEGPTWSNPGREVKISLPTVVPGPLEDSGTPGAVPTTPTAGPIRAPTAVQGTAHQPTVSAWADSLTIPASGGKQTIHGQLTDGSGHPLEGGHLYAVGHFTQGKSEVWLSDVATDSGGNTSVSFTSPVLPRGFQVVVDIYMTFEGKSYSAKVTFIVT